MCRALASRHLGPTHREDAMSRTLLLLGALSIVAVLTRPILAQDNVFVNGERVTQDQYARQLAEFGVTLPVPVPDGDY